MLSLQFVALLSIVVFSSVASALPSPSPEDTVHYPIKIGKRCTGTIASMSDVASAETCTTIVIKAFTVPAGQTFTLAPADGASVTMTGDVTFGYKEWAGPLMIIQGNNIKFNGGGYTLKGQGELYWDGQGGNGGKTKPAPLLRVNQKGGSFTNTKLLNTPARAISIGGSSLLVEKITVDDSAGDAPNSASGSKAAGHNTDGFDISAHDVIVQNNIIKNQDDCLAVNKGTNITFQGNQCSGGHGVSIGSIDSSTTVDGVTLASNTITNSQQCLRIKTKAAATGSTVSNIIFKDNTASGCEDYGVLISQSYPDSLGTPGTGVIISGVKFTGKNTVKVNSGGDRLDINCGSTTSCAGTWDLSGLTITGGDAGTIKNVKVSGGTY